MRVARSNRMSATTRLQAGDDGSGRVCRVDRGRQLAADARFRLVAGGQASSPCSAAPTTGGALVACTRIPSPTRASPASIAASRRGSPARRRPPPSTTSMAAARARGGRSRRARARRPRRRVADDRGRDLVGGCLREDDGRQLDQPPAARSRRRGSPRRARAASRSRRGAGTACSRLVRGPRPSSLRAATNERREADVVPAAPVAGDRAERGEADVAAVGATPTQLMPAPHTTATPQPRSVPARRTASVSLPTIDVAGPAARRERASRSAPPRRGSRHRRGRAGRPAATGRRAVRPAARTPRRAAPAGRDRPLEPEMVRRGQRPAHVREERAVLAHEREVGLRVAAVDGQDDRSLIALPPHELVDPRAALERASRRARPGRSADARAAPSGRSPGRA